MPRLIDRVAGQVLPERRPAIELRVAGQQNRVGWRRRRLVEGLVGRDPLGEADGGVHGLLGADGRCQAEAER